MMGQAARLKRTRATIDSRIKSLGLGFWNPACPGSPKRVGMGAFRRRMWVERINLIGAAPWVKVALRIQRRRVDRTVLCRFIMRRWGIWLRVVSEFTASYLSVGLTKWRSNLGTAA